MNEKDKMNVINEQLPGLEYNSARAPLIIPEYGRQVQRMVEHCTTIENREERNRVAQDIIDVIGNLNPHLRDTPDFQHILWDHLFIMSNFRLDVDSPYPIPTPESFQEKPKRLEYPKSQRRFRHYGQIVQTLIDHAISMDGDDELKEILLHQIANQMKKSYLTWNKDHVDDDVILKDLREMSGNKLNTDNITISNTITALNAMGGGQKPKQKRTKRKVRGNKPRFKKN